MEECIKIRAKCTYQNRKEFRLLLIAFLMNTNAFSANGGPGTSLYSCDLRTIIGVCEDYKVPNIFIDQIHFLKAGCEASTRGNKRGLFLAGTECPRSDRYGKCASYLLDSEEPNGVVVTRNYYRRGAEGYSWGKRSGLSITCSTLGGNWSTEHESSK